MSKLAIDGGTQVRSSMLPYGQQWIDEKDTAAVIEVLKSGFITQGPQIPQFESAVAEYAGARYAVAFSNGTAALHGACFAAGIKPGDEVITTPVTFLASSNCVLYQGAKPVFADIDPLTYNIDPEDIVRKITGRTKALIPVDFTGQPADMERILEIARQYGLTVIHDAAHSLGASFGGKKVGSFGDMTMFSFHPVKHITTGEGGIIVTDNERHYEKLLLFRNHGMTKEPHHLIKNDGPWYYEMQELGYNCRITDLQAALGLSQLTKLDFFVNRRRSIAAAYSIAFSELPGVTTPLQHPKSESGWHLYVLRFDLARFTAGRREIFDALRAENIGVHVHYIPVYLQPYYRQLGYPEGLCSEAENYYSDAITLPIFPKMSDGDIADVITAVDKVYRAYYKG